MFFVDFASHEVKMGGPATCPDFNLTKLQTNVATKRSTISINMQ